MPGWAEPGLPGWAEPGCARMGGAGMYQGGSSLDVPGDGIGLGRPCPHLPDPHSFVLTSRGKGQERPLIEAAVQSQAEGC